MECSSHHIAIVQETRDFKRRGGKFLLYTEWSSNKIDRPKLLSAEQAKVCVSARACVCVFVPLCAPMCYLGCSMQPLLWQQGVSLQLLWRCVMDKSDDLCSTSRLAIFVYYVSLP